MPLEKDQFERWWPEVAPRLTRSLARRGVAVEDADDVVQETALRALAAAPPVASADELARWSYTVARRISIDRDRRRGRSELLAAELASLRPTGTDTARAAESRVNLAAAARGLAALSANDRAALLSVLEEDAGLVAVDRRTAVRLAVRRHRARLRLVAAVGKLVGVGLAGVQGLRRLAGRVRPAYAEAGLAVLAVGALLLSPSGSGPATAAPLPSAGTAPTTTTTVAPVPASAAMAPAAPVHKGSPRPAPTAATPNAAPPTPPPPPHGDPPPISIPVGPGPTLLPVFVSSTATVDPNRPIACAYGDPDVECMKSTVRVKDGVRV